ncbi:MAG: DNA transfer protein p32 [Bdellovibrionales bacterium]|nr:DNA transfer protein p32 [Bdellovibrionales bacterium]
MSAAVVAGVVGVAGTMYAASEQRRAAKSAANAQKNAALSANQLQLRIHEDQQRNMRPWQQAGERSLNKLEGQLPELTRRFSMADFQKDPGYQFRMDEGLKAIDRSAAARGGLNSGRTLKSLTRFGQDYASNEYSNAYNRFTNDQNNIYNKYASLANVGQTANNQLAQAGQNYANQVGANNMGAANAQAASQIASANANSQMVSNLGNIGMNTWMQYQMMNK